MPSDEKQLSQGPTADTPQAIQALFKFCERKQDGLDGVNPKNLADFFRKESMFVPLLFPSAPKLDGIDLLIWKGRLHEELVEILKEVREASDGDRFRYVLAQWLRSEGIREPDDFFPPKVMRPLKKGVDLYWGDTRNSYVVRVWLPYSEPLVRRYRWFWESGSKDPSNSLLALGYHPTAVNLICSPRTAAQSSPRWRSAVEFTSEWVASQSLSRGTRYERETLRNSYSRCFGKWRFRLTNCFICDKPADNEFWAHGESVLHCKEHRADKLPTSESSAWTDRAGCRWWREDLNIRRGVTGVSP
jgi:hypothetical protein